MGRILFVYLMCIVGLYASTMLKCSAPSEVFDESKTLLGGKTGYTDYAIDLERIPTSEDAPNSLNSRVDISIIRADVAYYDRMHADQNDTKTRYKVLASLPFFGRLNLIQAPTADDIDIDMLRGKNISVGQLGDGNAVLLNILMDTYGMSHRIHTRAIGVEESKRLIDGGNLDAFFGFLLPGNDNDGYHYQTLFSKRTLKQLAKLVPPYKIEIDGVYVPYLLIGRPDLSDESIENILYRLIEHKSFRPVTIDTYGAIDRLLPRHVEQVQKVMQEKSAELLVGSLASATSAVPAPSRTLSSACLKYHYGFLDLLRRKPALKKKAYRSGGRQARATLGKINAILIAIDREKSSCDISFFEMQKRNFFNAARSVGYR